MNAIISAVTHAALSLRRAGNRPVARLTRKASIKLSVTVSVPAFLKIVLDYRADLGQPANDNRPARKLRRPA